MNGKEYIHNLIHRNNHRNFRYMKIQVTKCMISNTKIFPTIHKCDPPVPKHRFIMSHKALLSSCRCKHNKF